MRKFSHYLWVLAGAELGQSVRRFPSRRGRPSTVYLEHGPKQVGKIALVSWQQPRGVLVEARTIEIKILFLVFFPLILDMLSRLRFWINIVRLRWYFYAVLELIFFYIIRECEFKRRYGVWWYLFIVFWNWKIHELIEIF